MDEILNLIESVSEGFLPTLHIVSSSFELLLAFAKVTLFMGYSGAQKNQ